MGGGGRKDEPVEVSDARTSSNGWLREGQAPSGTVEKLSERISWVIGLSTAPVGINAEELQVANYVNGGLYLPHHDYFKVKEENPDHVKWDFIVCFAALLISLNAQLIYQNVSNENLYVGDRIATWMFYLSDAGEGGRTVFPKIGAGVKPKVGSAVFW